MLIKSTYDDIKSEVYNEKEIKARFKVAVSLFFSAKEPNERIGALVSCEYVVIGSEFLSAREDEPNPIARQWNRLEPMFRSVVTEELEPDEVLDSVLTDARKKLIENINK